MKTLILSLLALTLAGCGTTNQKNAAAFVAKLGAMNISASKIQQTTTGPFYNHAESATGLTVTPTGFSLIDVSVQFNIPVPVLGVPLLGWSFSAQTIAGSKIETAAAGLSPPK